MLQFIRLGFTDRFYSWLYSLDKTGLGLSIRVFQVKTPWKKKKKKHV